MSRIYFIAIVILLTSVTCYLTFAESNNKNAVASTQAVSADSDEVDQDAKKSEAPSDASAEEKKSKEEAINNNTHYCMIKNPIFNEKDPVLFDTADEEDNTSCLVCHADFAFEEITSTHLDAGCTCMSCHGDSDEHRADEYGYIRPDVIWGHGEQAAFCQQCHPKHKNPSKVEEFRKENFSKRLENGRWVNERSTCMDCHGNHAISGTKEGEFK